MSETSDQSGLFILFGRWLLTKVVVYRMFYWK